MRLIRTALPQQPSRQSADVPPQAVVSGVHGETRSNCRRTGGCVARLLSIELKRLKMLCDEAVRQVGWWLLGHEAGKSRK